MNDCSDNELIARAIDDQVALTALVTRYLSRVYGFAYGYMKNREDAEDATQEVFVKVWRNLKRFNQAKPFTPWVLQIAKRTCLDMLRRRSPVPFAVFEQEDGSNPVVDGLAVEPVVTEPAGALVADVILGALPERMRRVVAMRYHGGYNFREIAQALKQPLNTVKSLHRRALLKLRRMVGGSGG